MARFSGRLSAKFFEDSTARALFRVPGELKDDIRNGTVLSVYSHWKSCLNVGSASTITLPTKDNIREFEGEVVHHVPTVSELVPFNPVPIERENRTLHPISGSGVSLRGVADKTLRKVVSVLGNQIKNIILKASLERLPSFKDELGKLLTTLDNVGAEVSSLRAMIDALMLSYHHGEVNRLREDKIAVEKAPVLSATDAETLDALRVSFERLRNGFRDLSWE
ncbi:hypothetical protein ACE6H2_025419 [Prunus campanulata]